MTLYTFAPVVDLMEEVRWSVAFCTEANAGLSRKKQALGVSNARRLARLGMSARVLADGEHIGFASWYVSPAPYVHPAEPMIRNVYVLPDHRGRGHFHALIPALVGHVGAKTIELADYNYDAYRDFYIGLGFRHAIYMNARRDVLLAATDEAVAGLTPVEEITDDFDAVGAGNRF